MAPKTTTVYTFWEVDEHGYISEENYVKDKNDWNEDCYNKFPVSGKYPEDKYLNSDMFENKVDAAIQSNKIIDIKIKELKEEIASIEREIRILEERHAANLD